MLMSPTWYPSIAYKTHELSMYNSSNPQHLSTICSTFDRQPTWLSH